jgi:hypothetical protein
MASPESVHDIKWMSFFSEDIHNKVYLITEKCGQRPLSEDIEKMLSEKNITLSGAITPYSLLKPIKLIRSVRFVRRICKEQNIDIVHAFFATPYAMWAYFTGKKYIITTRGSDVLHVLPGLKKQGLNKLYLLILYGIFKKAFKKATFITSTSYVQVEKIKQLFKLTNTEVIRTGVDVDIIDLKIDKSFLPLPLQQAAYINSPRWIGPLYNSKDQALAVLMLDEAIIEKYIFVFYTNINTTAVYLNKFEKILQRNKRIKYLIFSELPQQNILACIKFASLNIMIPDRDGTPNSALEAMAARSPLIMGNFAYDEDLFKDTCIRLKENTAEALSASIINTLNNYPAGLLENAFKRVSEYGNRPVEMNKVKMLYEKMMG